MRKPPRPTFVRPSSAASNKSAKDSGHYRDYKLEAVNFTNERKRELFSRAKEALQGGTVKIPADSRLRDDLAGIQRIVTPQGLVKYLADRTGDGLADRATALALALHAATRVPEGNGVTPERPPRIGRDWRRGRTLAPGFERC